MLKPIILTLAILACRASAVSLEFTYYYPDRVVGAAMRNAWGPQYQWPLKTLPETDHDHEKGLANSYGCVYWPGEKITITVKGDPGVTSLVCANVLKPKDTLACAKSGSAWTVTTSGAGKAAPYFEVYRVHAFAGAKEVASRGFVLALPWGGVTAQQGYVPDGDVDPRYYSSSLAFGEWRNGSNPFWQMCFSPNSRWIKDDVFPLRTRPWGDLDVNGLPEIYFYRVNYKSLNTDNISSQVPLPNSDFLLDPSFEWNYLWCYYARGAGMWGGTDKLDGDWQWGPFGNLDPGTLTSANKEVNTCYGTSMRRHLAAMPNGFPYWQLMYYGVYMLCRNHGTYAWGTPEVNFRKIINAYDGWDDEFLWGAGSRAIEVGDAYLYYQRCKALGKSTAWTTNYNTFWDFNLASWKAWDPEYMDFIQSDLNMRHQYIFRKLAPLEAYKAYKGAAADYIGYSTSGTDLNLQTGMAQDYRLTDTLRSRLYPGWRVLTGQDRMHTYAGRFPDQDTRRWRTQRAYRIAGMRAGIECALYPERYYGGAYNYETPAGAYLPGSPNWMSCYNNSTSWWGDTLAWSKYHWFEDDGTSHRRMDMFERLPMFYRPGGKLASWEVEYCLGGLGYHPSDTSLWNTQVLLGEQLMEIPDRTRPIGGVCILDSDNKRDRDAGGEFCTRGPYADYLAGLHDSLGIVTFANPATEKDIPSDIPRVYMVKKVNGSPYMVADVGGKHIQVPYTGPVPKAIWENPILGPTSAEFNTFVQQIKAAYPGGWPIKTTGGFAATAWESSKGVWAYVENPMQDSGVIHTARKGSVTARIRGLNAKPAVIDLCGYDPDPGRLADSLVSVSGEFLTFKLDWQKGDSRLFYIDFTPAPSAIFPKGNPRSPMEMPKLQILGRRFRITAPYGIPFALSVHRLDGTVAFACSGTGSYQSTLPLGNGSYLAKVKSPGGIAYQRFMVMQ